MYIALTHFIYIICMYLCRLHNTTLHRNKIFMLGEMTEKQFKICYTIVNKIFFVLCSLINALVYVAIEQGIQ